MMSARSIRDVVNRLNSDADYRSRLFQNPREFLQSELGITITTEIDTQLRAYYGELQRARLNFRQPGAGEEVYAVFG
jgi:hypothetical protein